MTKDHATANLPPRQIETVAIHHLKPAPQNARTHSKKQIAQVANSMKRFGVINPLVVDGQNRIIAGHARAEAGKLLGLHSLPVIRLTELSDVELRAYMLADNKIALNAGWDRALLSIELAALQLELPTMGLELEITGFDPGEVDAILSDLGENPVDPSDEIPAIEPIAVAQRGELFVLGPHRILVGDARDEKAYAALMGSEKADMAFLDPPYNVKVQGHVGGRGRTKHREFKFASGEMTSAQFIDFLSDSLGQCAANLAHGAIAYVCMDWRHCAELLKAGARAFDELKNICVWTKSNAGQGTFYRNQHEFVFVYKRGTAPHLNTFGLGQNGRNRSNVWTYQGVNSFRAGRMDELKLHPTVKPVALISDAMKDCSRRGSVILDSFSGSGSTIVAAEHLGRRAYCIEVDPQYVDVSIRRWQTLTRKDAVLERTGQTFDELSSLRAAFRSGGPAVSKS
jgi:DNA modification methylase